MELKKPFPVDAIYDSVFSSNSNLLFLKEDHA